MIISASSVGVGSLGYNQISLPPAPPAPSSSVTPPASSPSASRSSAAAKAAADDIDNYESLAKAATKGLSTIQNYVKQLSALATQAASGAITDTQRAQLNTKFQGILKQLKNFIATDTFQGKPLFDGSFAANAGASGSLGAYIFTGAANEPTPQQAELSLPDMLSGLKNLSLANPADAASATTALQALGASAVQTTQQIGDFKATLQFADNTLKGIPNTGPSITQVDTVNQAEQLAGAATTGIADIQSLLGQLNNLATQAASSSLSDTDRGFLNQEFASMLNDINAIVSQTTSQSGTPLLDGSLNYDVLPTLRQYLLPPMYAAADLQISNLDTDSLFSGATPDILTQSDAENAITAIYNASNTVAKAADTVKSFTAAIDSAKQSMEQSKGDFSLSLLA